MSYKSEWEAILKLGDLLSSDLVNEYSDKLSSLCTSEFSMYDDTYKREVLKDNQISNIGHINYIIVKSKVMQTRANIFTNLGSQCIKESNFYRYFRAAVLTNRKQLDSQQVTRDDLIDPVDVLELPHNSTRSDISSKIFIRDCYRTLLDILCNSKTYSHVLLGTPGIGKSHFAIYFVYTLIKLGKPFIIDSSYSGVESKVFLLKSDGYLVLNDEQSILQELGNQFFWYVVDRCKPRKFVDKANFKCFYIDTANASNLKDYLDCSSQYFFPCWTLDEIEKCINKCSITTNTEPKDNPLYKQLFKIVGGVPRYVFASTIQDCKDYIKRPIIDCDIPVLIDSLNYRVFLDKYISKLVQPIVDDSNLSLSKIEFVSDYVAEDLVDVLQFRLLDQMTTLISTIENSSFNAIAGRIVETLMIRKFKEGNKQFSYRRLIQGKGNKQVEQLTFNVPELEEVLFDENSFMDDLKSQVDLKNHKHVLLVPKNKTLDAVDAFMLPNICLQFTIKQKNHHIAATNNFKRILDVMRNFCKENGLTKDVEGGDNFKFKYIFVVPDRCYENFGSQAVKCNESPTEQDLEETKKETEELKDIALTDLLKMTRKLLDMSLSENSVSEIEEMEDNDEEELKRKRTQLNLHVETKAQLLKIIEIATRYKKMKTDLEAEISKQIVQYVLQVEFDNNKLLVGNQSE